MGDSNRDQAQAGRQERSGPESCSTRRPHVQNGTRPPGWVGAQAVAQTRDRSEGAAAKGREKTSRSRKRGSDNGQGAVAQRKAGEHSAPDGAQKGPERSEARKCFQDYWGDATLAEALQLGRVFECKFRVNVMDHSEAYATVEGLPQEVLLKGDFQNRALEGDRVAVKILPSSYWWISRASAPAPSTGGGDRSRPSPDCADRSLGPGHGGREGSSPAKGGLSLWMGDPSEFVRTTWLEAGPSPPSNTSERASDLRSSAAPFYPCGVQDGGDGAGGTCGDVDQHGRLWQQFHGELEAALRRWELVKDSDLKTKERPKVLSLWEQATDPEDAKDAIRMVLEGFPTLRPTGQVVGITRPSPKRDSFVGVLHNSDTEGLRLHPLDPKLPKMLKVDPCSLEGNDTVTNEAKVDGITTRTLLRARIQGWSYDCDRPVAEITNVLGKSGNLEAESEAILEDEHIRHQAFSEEELSCVPPLPWSISDEDLNGRKDFRAVRIFTIDPPTARDLDDALSIEPQKGGLYRVGVHIADVSHFVKPNTALDREAKRRATSVYLVQNVIPMLPEALCQDICSLNPGTARLTYSVVWDLTDMGEIRNQWIGKSVIQSCAKLAYSDVQRVIGGEDVPEAPVQLHDGHEWSKIKEDVLLLHKIAKQLRRQRYDENGALSLHQPKLHFHLDANGHPVGCAPAQSQDANHLIEEFMLLANMTVAKVLAEKFPHHALLRAHPPPNSKIQELTDIGIQLDIPFDLTSARGIQHAMSELLRRCPDYVAETVMNLATRPMQLAYYFCTGKESIQRWRHYALAVDRYTHFTSPIRRYPDVVVHRLLDAIHYGEPFSSTLTDRNSAHVKAVATTCNERRTCARNAQDKSSRLHLMVLLEASPVVACGVVASVRGNKFFEVYVPRLGLMHKLHVEDLSVSVCSKYDTQRQALTLFQRDGAEKGPGKVPGKGTKQAPRGDACRRDVDSVADAFGLGVAEDVPPPLTFPVVVRRFSRVPVVVTAVRDAKIGRFLDVGIDLVVDKGSG
eukprot:evm.model.scf_211.9 EVM.evm.TU.scf_211.9   scf_211:76185-84721(+)